MTIDEFIQEVAAQYEDLTCNLYEDSRIRDLPGWGSIVGLGIIMMVRMNYGVTISPDVLKGLQTVREIYDYVVQHKEVK